MAILSKIQLKYSIMLDIAVLVILIVMQSLLHEASHALAVVILGGKVDAIVIKTVVVNNILNSFRSTWIAKSGP